MKVDDKVRMKDGSWGFGIINGKYVDYITNRDGSRDGDLVIVKTGLYAMRDANGTTQGTFRQQNDLLVTNGKGDFWFTQSRFCELVNKEIEVRYICNGEDVTDSISEETKRGLLSIAR